MQAGGGPADVNERIAALEATIAEHEETKRGYKAEVEENEKQRMGLQREIDEAMRASENTSFLQVLGAFRVQAVKLQEQQFQVAVRDQVIEEQRSAIANIWRVVDGAGISREDIKAIALKQGTLLQGLVGLKEDDVGPTLGPGSKGWKKQSLFSVTRANFRYDFWNNKGEGAAGGGLFSTVKRSTNFLRGRRGAVAPQS